MDNEAVSVSRQHLKLDLYDIPLTLPAQSALGGLYGRRAYCTYPKIEPKPEKLNLLNAVGSVADMAIRTRPCQLKSHVHLALDGWRLATALTTGFRGLHAPS